MAKFGIGQPMQRSEDPRLLKGNGRYTDDVSLPGQAQGYFLRSPMAHAAILSIDLEAARAAPGVVGIVTGDDLTADGIGTLPCKFAPKNRDGSPMPRPPRPALAVGRVRHVGEPVALIVAETLDQAKDAAELIEVDYDALPAITDLAGSVKDGAPQIWDEAPGNLVFDWEIGDKARTEDAFSKAAHRVTLDLVNNRVVANSMEARACLAGYDGDSGRFTFYVSSQGVHGIKDMLADEIFNLPADRFHVLTTDVGGGFGMKIFMYPEYVATLYAARKLGRPVKWISDRSEAFLSDDHGRDHLSHVELALDADGRFLGMRVETLANLGAYLSQFSTFIPTMAGSQMLTGLYTLPAVYLTVRGAFTNTQPVDAYRGAGRPEAAFLVERTVDLAARELGLTPAEIRRRNFVPPEAMPYDTALGLTYDSGEFQANMERALEKADWDGFEARRQSARKQGKLRGMGLATYIEACAGGSPENAQVTIDRAAKATILIGTQTNGQGHETAYKQVLAEYLGIPPEDITVVQGDSDVVATGGGTGGSRSVPVGGAAIAGAAGKILEKAKQRAADMLEAASADIAVEDGRFTIVGTDRSITFADIARDSAEETAFAEGGDFDPPASTFPNGAHICELEVDPDTGGIEILKYTVVDDFGKVLNPQMIAGQVHGGIAQGIGQALHEHAVFDPETGQLLSGSFMDYAMPRADNLPFVDLELREVLCKTNLLGMKGAGEAGAIGAPPAVINAVIDALKEYDVRHIDMPATPLRVWQTIQDSAVPKAAE
ncbi:MAG: xanthine dehydrogenase family protein molybdopterin-binding subunit [Inquilinaceae bacterium]